MGMDGVIRARRFGERSNLESLADRKRESRLPEEPATELDRLIIL
jgi:hypothetical protein